jgi:hypothetical protein
LGRQVLAIEPRGHASHRQYPHDVPRIFAERGFELISEVGMASLEPTRNDPYMADYFAWRFHRAR